MATPELQGVALQNDNSMLRMQCGLGSYSCCDHLLGILLRHPSRAARSPRITSAWKAVLTSAPQQAAATSGCDIDILHGLRQRVATTKNGECRRCTFHTFDGPLGKPENAQATAVTRFSAGPSEKWGSGLRHASTPTHAATTYSASDSNILVEKRQRVAGKKRRNVTRSTLCITK